MPWSLDWSLIIAIALLVFYGFWLRSTTIRLEQSVRALELTVRRIQAAESAPSNRKDFIEDRPAKTAQSGLTCVPVDTR